MIRFARRRSECLWRRRVTASWPKLWRRSAAAVRASNGAIPAINQRRSVLCKLERVRQHNNLRLSQEHTSPMLLTNTVCESSSMEADRLAPKTVELLFVPSSDVSPFFPVHLKAAAQLARPSRELQLKLQTRRSRDSFASFAALANDRNSK